MIEVADIYPAVIANMAGENFEPSAYWDILTPDGTSIIRDELNDIYGYQFHAKIFHQALQGKNILQHTPRNITTNRSLISRRLFNK